MLAPELLLDAYRHGLFPMAVDKHGTIGWFSPDPRAVIPLDHRFHIPHGLRRVLKKQPFLITFDTDFPAVIRACAQHQEGTWISRQIVASYTQLHQLGQAHSVEVWRSPAAPSAGAATGHRGHKRVLVGGLYGVHIGAAFFGESMFHRVSDASKVALVALVDRLRANGFVLLDTQWQTPHLRQFGTYEMPRAEYLEVLRRAVAFACRF